MRKRLFSLPLLILAWASAGPQGDATGTWVATGVPYEPWTVILKQNGAELTGTMQQNGGLPGPAEIYAGTVKGDAISFKVDSPGGARTITFTGTIKDDQITLNRATQVNREEVSGSGLFGATADPQFTLTRGGTVAAPSTALSARPTTPAMTGPAGRWQATAVPNGPWTFEFAVAGDSLTGMIQQHGAPSNPVSIAAGKAGDTTISFKVLSPDGERIIAFNGRLAGNEISFVRQISQIANGTRGGNDLYGGSAPLQFVAVRAAANRFNFKGVEVDISAVQSNPNLSDILDSISRQIDLVDAVLMSPAQKAFMKSVPLVMVSSPGAENAAYGNGRVVLQSAKYSPEKPIILHELMHAYHDRKVPDGFANVEIQRLYEQAQASGKFPAGSYMLSNRVEYFAMMASVYLHGSAARDPFSRQAIQEKQPDCYAWLEKEFGRR